MPSVTAHPSPVRLGWLDMLRGLAALVVAVHHSAAYFTPSAWAAVNDWVNPGKYGVLLFFLISGYIIPASLERHGSLRAFWIGRAARIYPLLLACLVVTAVPTAFGWWGARPGLTDAGGLPAALAHASMLQDLLDVPNALNVLWTLSYEMVFYFLVAGLFTVGLHRASAPIATALAVAALALGGVLPKMLLSNAFGVGAVVLAVVAVLGAAAAAAVLGGASAARAGAIVGGIAALLLVVLNGRVSPWEGISLMAVMFLGTALYRAEHGQSRPWTAAAATAALLGCSIPAGLLHGYDALDPALVRQFCTVWAGPLLLALLSFAAGRAVRDRRMPGPLRALGAISFSVYLVHPILLLPFEDRLEVGRSRPLVLAGFLVVLLAVSWATHRWIELPFQRWGRRLAAPRPAPAPAPAPALAR